MTNSARPNRPTTTTASSHELPGSWETIPIQLAGSVRLGRQRSPDKQTGLHPTKYVRAANITPDGLNLTDLLEMDFTPQERAIFTLSPGDVLLTEASGSAVHVGRSALWTGELEDCCFQNTVIRFRPHVALPEYSLLVFRHYSLSGVFSRTARGVGIQHLSASRFAPLPFPLPPWAEQERIATAANQKLDDLREAEFRLHSALENLNYQVREVLAAAVSGTLLEPSLSKEDATTIEKSFPPDALTSSSSNIQQELFESLHDLTDFTHLNLPPQPPTWVWAKVDNLGQVKLGRQRSPKHHTGPSMRPYLRVANVFEEYIDTSDILTMNFSEEEIVIYELKAGDILLNEGQSPELVGRPAIYRGEVPGACFQNTLIRFRPGPHINADFALLVFRHYLHADIFRQIARWSTNIAHLGLKRFRELPFPVPPLPEQEKIAAEARSRLNTITEQIKAVGESIARLPELEGEILSAAVTGQLLEQHSSDEPASALLDRLGPPPKNRILPMTIQPPTMETNVSSEHANEGYPSHAGSDLPAILKEAARPLSLPELFSRTGLDRNQPEHIELFYLNLRNEIGNTLRSTGTEVENAQLELIDAD